MLKSLAIGVVGVVATIFAVFFGIIFLLGRFNNSDQRQPLLYPFGIACFMVPTWFVLLAIKSFYLNSPGGGRWFKMFKLTLHADRGAIYPDVEPVDLLADP